MDTYRTFTRRTTDFYILKTSSKTLFDNRKTVWFMIRMLLLQRLSIERAIRLEACSFVSNSCIFKQITICFWTSYYVVFVVKRTRNLLLNSSYKMRIRDQFSISFINQIPSYLDADKNSNVYYKTTLQWFLRVIPKKSF